MLFQKPNVAFPFQGSSRLYIMRLLFLLIVSDGGVFMVVCDGGVTMFRGGLGQLHIFWKRTPLIHAPRAKSVICLLFVVRKGLPIPVIIS